MSIDTSFANAKFLQGEPVLRLPSGGAPKGYSLLRAWAMNIFVRVGGFVRHPVLGSVALDARAVRDSMGHGMSPIKAEAFAAVPVVIERGVIVHTARFGNTDSYYISAPVQIADVDDSVTVLVRKDSNSTRMYLHSVSTKKYLLNTQYSEAGAKAPEQNGKASSGDVKIILQGLLRLKLDASLVSTRQPPPAIYPSY